MPPRDRRAARLLGAVALLAWALPPAVAERLPVTTYTAEAGLGHDHLRCALADSGGLLWFCTANGLARFDGAAFTRFGVADGLPSGRINDLLEHPPGQLWVATDAGVFALDATAPAIAGEPRFAAVPWAPGLSRRPVNDLELGSDGRLWAASDLGLLEVARGEGPLLRRATAPGSGSSLLESGLETLHADPGGLWLGGADGLARFEPREARALAVSLPEAGSVRSLLGDRRGRLWVGGDGGLFRLDPRAPRAEPVPYPGFAGVRVRSLFEASDGALWAGAVGGLYALGSGDESEAPRRYSVANGLRDETINALAEDGAGNLWLATDLGGAIQVVRGGLVTFDTPDGLGHTSVTALFESRAGALHAVGQIGAFVSRFDGDRFVSARPGFSADRAERLRRTPTHLFQARDGSWWAATLEGLFRFAPCDRIEDLARAAPSARYGVASGLPSDEVYFTFEDSHGDLWAATAPSPRGAFARFDRAADAFRALGANAGVPAEGSASALREDPSGMLWIGWGSGELLRGGRGGFERVALPARGAVADLLFDRRGGVWVATVGDGLWHAPDARATEPRWMRLGVAQGLASDDQRCLAEDLSGRIYVGSVEGVDRLEPESGALRHFSTADGLAQLETTAALRDRAGSIWFGTYSGLSRLDPGPEPTREAPSIRIAAIAVDDRPYPVPLAGAVELGPIELAAGRHRVRIDYFAPLFAAGETLRYELREGGAESRWGEPSRERSVVLAGLGGGRHEIEVRAVDARGSRSRRPARVALIVSPPFWHRTWFFALAASLVGALLFAGHRLRLRHAVAIERVRTRIAADLHDDLGASLARISLLAEAARADAGSAAGAAEMLGQIGETARALTGRAREIVWSLDPRFDDLASFGVRVREVASELLDPSGLAWSFATPPEAQGRRIRLRPEQRQHLLLVFKEALHNALKHAQASRIDLVLAMRGRTLAGEVRDDGRGLDPNGGGSGQGLRNLRARLDALGGELDVAAAPGRGTRVAFTLPLGAPDRTIMRLPRPGRGL